MKARNGFFAFVRKETLHILRDPRTMLIVLGIPVVQLLLFGFAISTEVNNIDFAVAAPHPSETVRRVVARIAANDYFTFRGYVDAARIDRVLRTAEADVVVVFADDFDRRRTVSCAAIPAAAGETTLAVADGKAAVQLIFDASNPNTAAAGAGYLQSILTGEDSLGTERAGVEMRLLYNPQMKSAYNFVPGIMGLLFILICSIMTSVSIVREKESGTMEVLLVSPVRPVWIVFAKMIPYFLLSCFDLSVILLLARYVLGVPMSGSIAGIVGVSILYLLLALALGLFISTIADRQATALVISAMLMLLPVIMLSGMVFPVENMPGVLQALSCAIPARWYIEAVRKLMVQALPFSAVVREFLILLAMTLALIGIALRKFNDKLE
ncbi:MAG TPA: ABC transporter permease [Candidatus Alistipes intestinigallinarum]|uniref:Transport permease protein n=1 Tax=Candidatus Alistipes intestinigallinarum TaxID=2838440 RepID=A0A9D2CCR4_9BACT|nr:ABC transporter permease [Candidatus Alistipes intestinigallinarum]